MLMVARIVTYVLKLIMKFAYFFNGNRKFSVHVSTCAYSNHVKLRHFAQTRSAYHFVSCQQINLDQYWRVVLSLLMVCG